MKSVVGNKNKFPGVSVPSKRSICESCGRQFPASTVIYGKLHVCYRYHVRYVRLIKLAVCLVSVCIEFPLLGNTREYTT